jgi:hypothetical protein
MKRIFSFRKTGLIFALIFIFQVNNQSFCQQFDYADKPVKTRPFYFGFGLGINDYGIGINLEAPLSQSTSVNGNVGIGGWGFKFGGSINFYPSDNNHNEFSLGYSYASGLKNFNTELTVEPYGNQQTVNFDLYGVSSINVTYTYNINVGRSSKVAISGGYAICLTEDAYDITNSMVLDETSKLVMNMMKPGGLIIGVKLMIGGL